MNILRLSLFKLKKNKKEAVAIAFLTMITTLMLAVFTANISKANRAYEDSFGQAGSKDTCVMIKKDKFRDEYRTLLEEDYGITDITEAEAIYASSVDYKNNGGEDRTYESVFVTEKNERKIEKFNKADKLSDEEIEKLEHPIWLPMFFSISKGCEPGDTMTLCKHGREYPFTIAGFYITGLYNDSGFSYKMVISENDYELFKLIFNSGSDSVYTMLWFDSKGTAFNDTDHMNKCAEV
ncbi:MAG: hypothetical protein IJ723_04605, partial [Ruminococcus sp.]|nr:hypothetical protein [Ruminococcus sp.]